MLREGLILIVTGMGTVFTFLIILIFTMILMEKVVIILNKLMPEEAPQAALPSNGKNINQEIAAAIAAIKSMK